MGKPMNLRVATGLAILLLAGCLTSGGPVRDANAQTTPLHEAAMSGDAAAIRTLLAGGADVNMRAKDGVTPLHAAAASGHFFTIEALLADGADVNAQDDDGSTPLHQAVMFGEMASIQALLADGADVNAKDDKGSTPLHVAAASGDVTAIRALLTGGAAVNARNENGRTPLHSAAIWNRAAIIPTLLAGGANVNARARNGVTPLHAAAARKTIRAALEADAKGGHDELLRAFSVTESFGLDTLDETEREMVAAFLRDADDDRADTVRALLADGANVNARAKGEATPLHYAALSGDAAAVEALLNVVSDPNAVAFGCSPMDVAQRRMESTETSISPFRDSIEALRAAGGRPLEGCKL